VENREPLLGYVALAFVKFVCKRNKSYYFSIKECIVVLGLLGA